MIELGIRRMGRTKMRPRALALGAAYLWNHPERETVAAIHRALDLGIDYIDTYAGHSEEFWGRALQGRRMQVYLQAKVGCFRGHRYDYSAAFTRWTVENSLKLLCTDYLDVVLIHGYDECLSNPDINPANVLDPLAPGNALDELLTMKEEGLIRHAGMASRSHEVHRRAIETGHVEVVLSYLDYTLVDQSLAKTTVPLARQHGVGLILASALGMGLFTGQEPRPDLERRRWTPAWPSHPAGVHLPHAMWAWCRERDIDIRRLAIQFCLAAPIDGVVMTGPANVAQVESGHEAATAKLPPQVWADFEAEFGVGIDPSSSKEAGNL